jgi:hypothetical protein
MKQFLLLLGITLFLSPAAIASPEAQQRREPITIAQQVQDINGWNGLVWGMSQDEVKAIFSDTTASTNDRGHPQLVMQGVSIAGQPFSASFVFLDQKLSRVVLDRSESIGTGGAASITVLFNEIQAQLIAKYGDFHKSSSIPGLRVLDWYLPSSEIALLQIKDPEYGRNGSTMGNSIRLIYRQRAQSPL